jgi:glc operon protein GlcG
MANSDTLQTIHKMLDVIEKLIPSYMEVPEDKSISNGNVAVCIIENDSGRVHGRVFGTFKPRGRETYKIAWTKASQVWLTGVKTGEYERMVFNKEIPENANGIENPDLIGWEGGQPLTLKDGTKLSVGFSGFRGTTDLEIMVKALAVAESD